MSSTSISVAPGATLQAHVDFYATPDGKLAVLSGGIRGFVDAHGKPMTRRLPDRLSNFRASSEWPSARVVEPWDGPFNKARPKEGLFTMQALVTAAGLTLRGLDDQFKASQGRMAEAATSRKAKGKAKRGKAANQAGELAEEEDLQETIALLEDALRDSVLARLGEYTQDIEDMLEDGLGLPPELTQAEKHVADQARAHVWAQWSRTLASACDALGRELGPDGKEYTAAYYAKQTGEWEEAERVAKDKVMPDVRNSDMSLAQATKDWQAFSREAWKRSGRDMTAAKQDFESKRRDVQDELSVQRSAMATGGPIVWASSAGQAYLLHEAHVAMCRHGQDDGSVRLPPGFITPSAEDAASLVIRDLASELKAAPIVIGEQPLALLPLVQSARPVAEAVASLATSVRAANRRRMATYMQQDALSAADRLLGASHLADARDRVVAQTLRHLGHTRAALESAHRTRMRQLEAARSELLAGGREETYEGWSWLRAAVWSADREVYAALAELASTELATLDTWDHRGRFGASSIDAARANCDRVKRRARRIESQRWVTAGCRPSARTTDDYLADLRARPAAPAETTTKAKGKSNATLLPQQKPKKPYYDFPSVASATQQWYARVRASRPNFYDATVVEGVNRIDFYHDWSTVSRPRYEPSPHALALRSRRQWALNRKRRRPPKPRSPSASRRFSFSGVSAELDQYESSTAKSMLRL
ncbi:hypothetical protein Q5752_001974 [Cryptotrichosporon argae]